MTAKATVASLAAYAYHSLPRDEADIFLEAGLRLSRAERFAHPEARVSDHGAKSIRGWVERRLTGEPIAYIVGSIRFLGIELTIDPRALIPRLDTEILVAAAIDAPGNRVLDIGTGSGAVAIALALQNPRREIVASDIDAAALALARTNIRRHQLPIACVQANLADPFRCCFDLIVSNPPYIEANDPHLAEGDLRYEPKTALIGGKAMLSALVQSAQNCLATGGRLLIEHGYDQAEFTRSLLADHGFSGIETHRDFEHRDRVTGGIR